jgi:hypothetical protein
MCLDRDVKRIVIEKKLLVTQFRLERYDRHAYIKSRHVDCFYLR